jgi:cystathionine beta-lyase
MGRHDFDEIVDRRDTDSLKWRYLKPDILPMWVADSDFRCPEPLLKLLEKRLCHGIFGYAHLDSLVEEAVLHWMQSRFGWLADKGCVAPMPGVCASLALVIENFTAPGDNVATFTPAYPPLFKLPVGHGRVSLRLPLVRRGTDYIVDFVDLEAKLALEKTSLFILCNPHNPTGKVFRPEELVRIGELCLKHNVLVFSDEVHCDYAHSGKHQPFASLAPDFAARSFTAVSPSKTFNTAGLQAAALLCPDRDLMARFKQHAEGRCLRVNTLGALALHAAYTQCAWYADEAAAYVRENLLYAVEYIGENIPALKVVMPEGTYLLWIDCSGLELDQAGMVRFFTEQARVGPFPGWEFGPEGKNFVRLNLACPRSTAREALARVDEAARALARDKEDA